MGAGRSQAETPPGLGMRGFLDVVGAMPLSCRCEGNRLPTGKEDPDNRLTP
jgi:hypothetical protein